MRYQQTGHGFSSLTSDWSHHLSARLWKGEESEETDAGVRRRLLWPAGAQGLQIRYKSPKPAFPSSYCTWTQSSLQLELPHSFFAERVCPVRKKGWWPSRLKLQMNAFQKAVGKLSLVSAVKNKRRVCITHDICRYIQHWIDLWSYFLAVLQTGNNIQSTILLLATLYFTKYLGDILH